MKTELGKALALCLIGAAIGLAVATVAAELLNPWAQRLTQIAGIACGWFAGLAAYDKQEK